MKLIGLISPANKEKLESLLDAELLGKALAAAGISQSIKGQNIRELSVNIANPEYDLKGTAADLAGAICISDSEGDGGDNERGGKSGGRKSDGSENNEKKFKDFLTAAGAEMFFTVKERRYWDSTNTATNMPENKTGINQMTFVRRISEIDHQEFSKRWAEHAPIAKEHHPGIARYTQNIVSQQMGRFRDPELAKDFAGADLDGGNFDDENFTDENFDKLDFDGENFDGVAELYFDSLSDMQNGMRKDETSHDIIFADINRFLNLKAGTRIFATQHLLLPTYTCNIFSL